MRRLLCLSLALFLFLSSPLYVLGTEVTDSTVAPAPDLSETAIPVSVEANSAIASVLIGAGVQPGTNLDDFNMLVSSCVTAMESEGIFTDGKIAFASNNVDGVQYMYAPVYLIDAVRNWLLDDSGVIFDQDVKPVDTITFYVDSTEYYFQFRYTTQVYVYAVIGTFGSDYPKRYQVYLRTPNSGADYRVSVNGGTFTSWRDFGAVSNTDFYAISYISKDYIDSYPVFSGIPVFNVGHFPSSADFNIYAYRLTISGLGYSTNLDLYLSDLSSAGYSSWLGTSVDYDGATFVPCSVMNTYDDTIQLPQEYVQGGITDYTPPSPPDVTVPDWESPDVPEYPGSESAPPDNELLWGIRVAVSETIPYWIKTTSASIVEWLQRIYNHITDTVAGLVGVLSTQHDALLAKLDELKAGFGGESSAGDELQGEVDRQDQELDDMTDVMDSVTKPDIEEIDPDLTDEVDQEKLTEFTTPFVTMMTQGPFATMLVMSLTLVLCSYILYGKR